MMTVECQTDAEPKTAYEYFRKHYSPPKKVVEIADSKSESEEQEPVQLPVIETE